MAELTTKLDCEHEHTTVAPMLDLQEAMEAVHLDTIIATHNVGINAIVPTDKSKFKVRTMFFIFLQVKYNRLSLLRG